jgi:hypothetical protein
MAAHRREWVRLIRVTTALTPIGVTMEVRAISSVISAVRCRGRMFLSRPLKLQRGTPWRSVSNGKLFAVGESVSNRTGYLSVHLCSTLHWFATGWYLCYWRSLQFGLAECVRLPAGVRVSTWSGVILLPSERFQVTGTYVRHFASGVKDNCCQFLWAFEFLVGTGDFVDKIGPKEFNVAN